jgi:ApbE superfamily uncharacterized protein (UPF0280 family)
MNRDKIQVEETQIVLETDLKNHDIVKFIIKERNKIKNYIEIHPEFLYSLEPISIDKGPRIILEMARAGLIAEVGPMAAVAGTISQFCLNYLVDNGAKYVTVDNGGDIALKIDRDIIVGLYSGFSSLSGKIGFKIKKRKKPRGICTSSGTVGHSISFGKADSVTVFASRASTADALATSIANKANGTTENEAVHKCLEWADELQEHFDGMLAIVGESAGTIGKIPKLVETNKKVVLGDLFDIN